MNWGRPGQIRGPDERARVDGEGRGGQKGRTGGPGQVGEDQGRREGQSGVG